jgi:hypothetical protein
MLEREKKRKKPPKSGQPMLGFVGGFFVNNVRLLRYQLIYFRLVYLHWVLGSQLFQPFLF